MASLAELLKRQNKLSIGYQKPINQLLPQQEQPIQQPIYQRPNIDPTLEAENQQNLQQSKSAKWGITPGNITGIAAGLTALTGGDPYLASGLGQASSRLMGQEQQAEQQRKNKLSDYIKGLQGKQSAYDIAQQKAQQAFKLQQLKSLEKENEPEELELKTLRGKQVLMNKQGEVKKEFGLNIDAKSIKAAEQGLYSVRNLNEIMFSDDMDENKFQQTFLGTKAGVFANQKSRLVRSNIINAVDVILRERTGAAINENERAEAQKAWGFNVGDSKNTVRQKIKDLEIMYKIMNGELDPTTGEGRKLLSPNGRKALDYTDNLKTKHANEQQQITKEDEDLYNTYI